MPEIPSSNCGCALPEGCWGSSGHHYRYFGSRDIPIPKEMSQDAERTLAYVQVMMQRYRNKWMAYEPCRPYQEAAKQRNRIAAAERKTNRGMRLDV